jgi:hypothetical protein
VIKVTIMGGKGRPPVRHIRTQCLVMPRRIYPPSTPSRNEDRRPGNEAASRPLMVAMDEQAANQSKTSTWMSWMMRMSDLTQ